MAELADATALGAVGETLGGSTPLPPTKFCPSGQNPVRLAIRLWRMAAHIQEIARHASFGFEVAGTALIFVKADVIDLRRPQLFESKNMLAGAAANLF